MRALLPLPHPFSCMAPWPRQLNTLLKRLHTAAEAQEWSAGIPQCILLSCSTLHVQLTIIIDDGLVVDDHE